MQLDPNSSLTNQLRNLSGIPLERLCAATFAYNGYTVFRNLRFEIDGQLAAEADLFGVLFNPLRESRIILECKGGVPSFKEIREYASLRSLLSPKPDDLIIICKEHCPPNIKTLADSLNVRLIEKPNIVYYVLPMVGGKPLRRDRARKLNRYLAWQLIHEYFILKSNSHRQMHQHYRFLVCDLWKIISPEEQVKLSFDKYNNTYGNTPEIIAEGKGINISDQVYTATDDDLQASWDILLMHRIMNVYAVVRRTLELMQHEGTIQLIRNTGPSLRQAISKISSVPQYIFGFPSFLQTFFYIWGGFWVNDHKSYEIEQMAKEAGTTPDAVEFYLKVLDKIYSGTGTSLFYEWENLTFFKYVPAAFRAIGIIHRENIDNNRYAQVSFFTNVVNTAYYNALDRALANIQGVSGLKF